MTEKQTANLIDYQRAQIGYRKLFAGIQSKRTAKRGRIQVLKSSRVVSQTGLETQLQKPNWTKWVHYPNK